MRWLVVIICDNILKQSTQYSTILQENICLEYFSVWDKIIFIPEPQYTVIFEGFYYFGQVACSCRLCLLHFSSQWWLLIAGLVWRGLSSAHVYLHTHEFKMIVETWSLSDIFFYKEYFMTQHV